MLIRANLPIPFDVPGWARFSIDAHPAILILCVYFPGSFYFHYLSIYLVTFGVIPDLIWR